MKIKTKNFIENYYKYIEYIWPDNIEIYEDKITINGKDYTEDEIEIYPSKSFSKIKSSNLSESVFINKKRINYIELTKIDYENKYFIITIFFDNKELKLPYYFLKELKREIKTIEEINSIREYIKNFIKNNFINFK